MPILPFPFKSQEGGIARKGVKGLLYPILFPPLFPTTVLPLTYPPPSTASPPLQYRTDILGLTIYMTEKVLNYS